MLAQQFSRSLECVLLDLNTQDDFLSSSGSCRVQNIKALIPAVRRVVAWAKWNHVPIVSSMDSHREGESRHDGFPIHCVDGSAGQQKIPYTLFGTRIAVEGDNTLAVPLDMFGRHQQVIFRKRTHDLLGNPKADRFLTQLPAGEFILFGVGLEFSIKTLALGLLAREKKVALLADGCGFWSRPEANLSLRLLATRGVHIMTVNELVARRMSRRFRYPLHGNGSNGRNGSNGHRGSCSNGHR